VLSRWGRSPKKPGIVRAIEYLVIAGLLGLIVFSTLNQRDARLNAEVKTILSSF
jgi:hypothetical protein